MDLFLIDKLFQHKHSSPLHGYKNSHVNRIQKTSTLYGYSWNKFRNTLVQYETCKEAEVIRYPISWGGELISLSYAIEPVVQW